MPNEDRASSSSPISSAPQSPQNQPPNGFSDTIHVARHAHTNPGFANGDGVVHGVTATPAAPSSAAQHTTSGYVFFYNDMAHTFLMQLLINS